MSTQLSLDAAAMLLNLISYAVMIAATLFMFRAYKKLQVELHRARRTLEQETKRREDAEKSVYEYQTGERAQDPFLIGKCFSPVKLFHTDIVDASPNPLPHTFQQSNTHDDARPKKNPFVGRTHPLASAVTPSLPSTPSNHGGEGEQAVNRNAHMHIMPSCKEIYESLLPEGMHIEGLIHKFKGRVNSTNTQVFVKRTKAVASVDKKKSWLTPVEKRPSDEQFSRLAGLSWAGSTRCRPGSDGERADTV
jgi:hypothetical protein